MGQYYAKHGTSRFEVKPSANMYSGGSANAHPAKHARASWDDNYLEYMFKGTRWASGQNFHIMGNNALNIWTQHDTPLQVPYYAYGLAMFTSGHSVNNNSVSTITGLRTSVTHIPSSFTENFSITDVLVSGDKVNPSNFLSVVVRLSRTKGGGIYSEYYDSGNLVWVDDPDTWHAFSSFNKETLSDSGANITGYKLSLNNDSFVSFEPETGRTYKIDVYIALRSPVDGLSTIGTSTCEFSFNYVGNQTSMSYYMSQCHNNSAYPFSSKWKVTPAYNSSGTSDYLALEYYGTNVVFESKVILPTFQLI